MDIHYILVILSIIVIIGIQIRVFYNTKKKIEDFLQIFPISSTAYGIVQTEIPLADEDQEADNEKSIEVSQIRLRTQNDTMKSICNALNMYLQKNKGAASDFNLMKDVVERYCNTHAEEINIQQPIPLYLGLMGTMVGIIIGIGSLALSGGLVEGFQMEHISSLMTCVAIAMLASLCGIIFTTVISWSAKNATSVVEARKNEFYSWLQTELLPVLSGNAVNALYLLQQNLMSFNRTFQSHIAGLDATLSRVENVSIEQMELMQLIKDLDVKKVAQANVAVLKELKGCTEELAVFNQYMHNVSTYLKAVNSLNDNLNEHLNRTAAIERMGSFFEKEINQVATREQYINEVVANVDNTLKNTFEQLSESTKEGINELRNQSVTEQNALNTYFEEQRGELKKMLQAQHEALAARPEENEAFIKELRLSVEKQEAAMGRLYDTLKGLGGEIALSLQDSLRPVLQGVQQSKGDDRQDAATTDHVEQPESQAKSLANIPKIVIYLLSAIAFLLLVNIGISIFGYFFY